MTELIWQPEKLIHYPLIEHVHVSPGSDAVLYTVRRAHITDNASEFRQQAYTVAIQGEPSPRALTTGLSAASPQWSPDGRYIAFLRKLPESEFTGLWLMDAAGGEPWPILPPTGAPESGAADGAHESIVHFKWRPDSKAIAFTAVPADEERRRRRRQKDDATRWRDDYDYAHLFIMEFAGEFDDEPAATTVQHQWRQITRGSYHIDTFAWHPQGGQIAFHAQDNPHIDSWTTSRLMTVETAASAAPKKIADIQGWSLNVAWSPDGAWLASLKGIEDNHWPYAGRMFIYSTQSSHEARPLAEVSDAQPNLIGWTPDSKAVLVFNEQGLETTILALPIDGSAPRTIALCGGPSPAAHVNDSGMLALVCQDHYTVNGVEIIDLAETHLTSGPITANEDKNDAGIPSRRRLTTPTASVYPDGPLPQIQELSWTTPDGFEIEGILYLPADYDAESGEKLPFLLHIHGGPMGVFQRTYAGTPYYYPPAALCELGCAILRANPRGSSGYGKDFRFANMLDWGGGDYRDLMQGVDTVIEMGIADPDRLGVCGWSYGGFMSSWIITQTHRFQAASIGAPLTNAMSFNATADIPGFVPDYYGGEAWEAYDFYRERSPIFHAHQVRTPTIMQHGKEDLRVPLEQGLQYYHVLRRNNVPVELYIYPRQGHAILEPRLLQDAIQRNITWFTKQLALRADRVSTS